MHAQDAGSHFHLELYFISPSFPKQLQRHAKEMKRAKTAAVHLDLLIDLKHLDLRYYEPMPAPLTLMPPAEGQSVLPCEGNPCGFACQACKAFKQVGICSHVLTINHILTRFNVRFQLKSIQTNALRKKAGLVGKGTVASPSARAPSGARLE